MEGLPELVVLKIIGYLPICNQVNTRKVCRLWKHLADECLRSRRELIVFYELARIPLFWGHNDQPIDLNNTMVVNWKFKASNFFADTFQSIRRLHIAYFDEPFGENLKELVDQYSRLEHFELKNVSEYFGRKIPLRADFYSENLRTLFISCTDGPINIHCPGLRKLSFYGLFHLTTELNPLFRRLEFLRVNSFSYERGVELSSLRVVCFADTIEIDIADFGILQEIHFFYHRKIFEQDFTDSHRRRRQWRMLIRTLNDLLEQKRTNERGNLMVYYDGFLYRHDVEFKKFLFSTNREPLLRTCFRNQITIENYPGANNFSHFARTIRNSKIENTLKSFRYDRNPDQGILARMVNRMNKKTAEKLSRSIWALYVNKDTFQYVRELNFRELFKHVKVLQFSFLSQNTLDLLPEMVPNVVCVLSFEVGRDVTNFNFLTRFKAMNCFFLHVGIITLDELKAVLDNCKITSFHFETPSGDAKGIFIKESEFIFETNGERETKISNKEDLLKHLDEIGLLKNRF